MKLRNDILKGSYRVGMLMLAKPIVEAMICYFKTAAIICKIGLVLNSNPH